MEDLTYLTLVVGGRPSEYVVLTSKIDDAAETIVANNKWSRGKMQLYLNKVSYSVSGIIIKGDYIKEYDISKWI